MILTTLNEHWEVVVLEERETMESKNIYEHVGKYFMINDGVIEVIPLSELTEEQAQDIIPIIRTFNKIMETNHKVAKDCVLWGVTQTLQKLGYTLQQGHDGKVDLMKALGDSIKELKVVPPSQVVLKKKK